jgi:hypothetical protein
MMFSATADAASLFDREDAKWQRPLIELMAHNQGCQAPQPNVLRHFREMRGYELTRKDWVEGRDGPIKELQQVIEEVKSEVSAEGISAWCSRFGATLEKREEAFQAALLMKYHLECNELPMKAQEYIRAVDAVTPADWRYAAGGYAMSHYAAGRGNFCDGVGRSALLKSFGN